MDNQDPIETATEMTHIDDWVREPAKNSTEWAVKAWLAIYRLRPDVRSYFDGTARMARITTTYEGERYKLVGASRMGDVWLAKDPLRVSGYDLRVDVAKCTDWEVTCV